MKQSARGRKYKGKILFLLLFIIMLCVIAGKILNPSFTTSFYDNTTHHIASEANGWNLILVNRDNYIPDDYKVQLTELSNGKRLIPEFIQSYRKCLMLQGSKDMLVCQRGI